MTYSFADLIAFISEGETLHPGELLGSGTVGTGCGMELGRRLASGDVVEREVEGIGVLSNRVVAGRRNHAAASGGGHYWRLHRGVAIHTARAGTLLPMGTGEAATG